MRQGTKPTPEPYARLTMDSATLYEMVTVSRLREKAYPWAKSAAVALTTSLVRLNHLEIAGTPGAAGPAGDHYAVLLNEIATLHHTNLRMLANTHPDRSEELAATKLWVRQQAPIIASAYLRLVSEKNKDFHFWFEQSKRSAWVEHAGRLGGLFNQEFIPEIACVLQQCSLSKSAPGNLPDEDRLRELLKLSQKQNALVTKNGEMRPDIEDELGHAYVVSAIIRGYFHQQSAALDGRQLTRHPFRSSVTSCVDKATIQGDVEGRVYEIGDTQTYFSNILIADALSEGRPEAIIRKWVNHVRLAADAYDDGQLDLNHVGIESRAQSKAIAAANKLRIVPVPKWLDEAFSVAVQIGSGLVPQLAHIAFPHVPSSEVWMESMAAGVVGRYIPTQRAREAAFNLATRNKLSKLASSGPGTVTYNSYTLPTE
jgi:hypothetical protein